MMISAETYILGIDTSCDDTSAAVVCGSKILSNVVSSQINLHRAYGGVFPTVAKLEHQKNIAPVVELALKQARVALPQIAALAVTVGPGLAPALEIGIKYAQELASQFKKPLIAINHVEAHALSPLLAANSKAAAKKNNLPSLKNALAVVVSGGHSEFIRIKKIGDYEILGQTLDDAAGECLDKIGRMLGLGYPAAPVVEQLAREGQPSVYPFPLPLTTVHDFNLSFSGLKTHAFNALRKISEKNSGSQGPLGTFRDQKSLKVPKGPSQNFHLSKNEICDFCAAAQAGVIRHLVYKLNKLFTHLAAHDAAQKSLPTTLLLGGGVAANLQLRQELRRFCRHWQKISKQKIQFMTPYSKKLCGDNAAMIAMVGAYKFQAKKIEKNPSAIERQPNLKITSWN